MGGRRRAKSASLVRNILLSAPQFTSVQQQRRQRQQPLAMRINLNLFPWAHRRRYAGCESVCVWMWAIILQILCVRSVVWDFVQTWDLCSMCVSESVCAFETIRNWTAYFCLSFHSSQLDDMAYRHHNVDLSTLRSVCRFLDFVCCHRRHRRFSLTFRVWAGAPHSKGKIISNCIAIIIMDETNRNRQTDHIVSFQQEQGLGHGETVCNSSHELWWHFSLLLLSFVFHTKFRGKTKLYSTSLCPHPLHILLVIHFVVFFFSFVFCFLRLSCVFRQHRWWVTSVLCTFDRMKSASSIWTDGITNCEAKKSKRAVGIYATQTVSSKHFSPIVFHSILRTLSLPLPLSRSEHAVSWVRIILLRFSPERRLHSAFDSDGYRFFWRRILASSVFLVRSLRASSVRKTGKRKILRQNEKKNGKTFYSILFRYENWKTEYPTIARTNANALHFLVVAQLHIANTNANARYSFMKIRNHNSDDLSNYGNCEVKKESHYEIYILIGWKNFVLQSHFVFHS